jgi:hypothetical protein
MTHTASVCGGLARYCGVTLVVVVICSDGAAGVVRRVVTLARVVV